MSTNEIEDQPSPEDYTVTPCGQLGAMLAVGQIEGKFLGEFSEWDDAFDAIYSKMDSEMFWPNVWFVSDHGNWTLVVRDQEPPQ